MAVPLKMGKYEMFKNGQVNVLSCTDIASRGLDTLRVGTFLLTNQMVSLLYMIYSFHIINHVLYINSFIACTENILKFDKTLKKLANYR